MIALGTLAVVLALGERHASTSLSEHDVTSFIHSTDTTISFEEVSDGAANRRRIDAELHACKWEAAGDVAEATSMTRESAGPWSSSKSIFHPSIQVGPIEGENKNLMSMPVEVCVLPARTLIGWANDPNGESEEILSFMRVRDITIPAGESLVYNNLMPPVPKVPPGSNRFIGFSLDWLVDESGTFATYPPLHPHHTSAHALNYPAIDGLKAYDPFIYLSLPIDALRSNVPKFNGTATTVFGRKTIPPGISSFCDPPEGDVALNRPLCDAVFNVPRNPSSLPDGADQMSIARFDNINSSVAFTGSLVFTRQFLISKPVAAGGAAITPAWNFQWKTGEGVLLQIPPDAGPSFAAHTYIMPRSGKATGNSPHMHNGVETQVWFIVGAHVSELVPSFLKSYIHEVHHFGEYRYGGSELTRTVDSPYGDTGTVLLAGSAYEDDLSGLKQYVTSSLPDSSMLRCMWKSNAEWLDDGTMVSLPDSLVETVTPKEFCQTVHVTAGTPMTVLSFFENNGRVDDWYTMHTYIQSTVAFDDDPFVTA
jgi:hypothetical protein